MGSICNFMVEGKEVLYEVDVKDQKGRVIGVKKVKSRDLKIN